MVTLSYFLKRVKPERAFPLLIIHPWSTQPTSSTWKRPEELMLEGLD